MSEYFDVEIYDESVFKVEYPALEKICRDLLTEGDWYFSQYLGNEYEGMMTSEAYYIDEDNEDRSAIFEFDGSGNLVTYDLNNID